PVIFVSGYAFWSLLPVPKNVATAAAGALFGVGPGAVLAWAGAMIGSAVAFGVARSLGREGVARLLRGRLETADRALGDRGFGAVLLARLVPVVPFTALNYGAAVTGVETRHYLAATALGMVPGTVAYAALGASAGTDPQVTAAALAALVLLSVGGWWAARRTGRLRAAAPDPESSRD
ncbi:MAG: TVP38/TMEM64 family protein, partial [Intrasporangiaceae bacterium]|nr:TVP38/TMEM64 family protein [Intrasporangiaceae bacterium]